MFLTKRSCSEGVTLPKCNAGSAYAEFCLGASDIMSGCLPINTHHVETRLIASLQRFYYGYATGHDMRGLYLAPLATSHA